MRRHILRDSLAGLNLRDNCEETGIGQSNVPSDRGKSSNPSFRNERDNVSSIPDASPRVDP